MPASVNHITMSDQTEKFIETVQKYTYLFDSRHRYYKSKAKREEAWDEIAKELNMSSDAAKNKWKNLRDSYMKFKNSSGDKGYYAKKYAKWAWSSKMLFLDKALQNRPKSSNVKKMKTEVETDIPSSEPTCASSLVANIDDLHQLQPQFEIFLPHPPKKQRKSHNASEHILSNADVDKVINISETKISNGKQMTGVDHLFASYAATFKTFRPRTQAMLKLKLATLFSETELSELQA